VRKRERERERERKINVCVLVRERMYKSVFVCVCECVRKGERVYVCSKKMSKIESRIGPSVIKLLTSVVYESS